MTREPVRHDATAAEVAPAEIEDLSRQVRRQATHVAALQRRLHELREQIRRHKAAKRVRMPFMG